MKLVRNGVAKMLTQTFNNTSAHQSSELPDIVQQALQTLRHNPSDTTAYQVVSHQLETYSQAAPDQIVRLRWRPNLMIEVYTPKTERRAQLVYEPNLKTFVEMDMADKQPNFWKRVFSTFLA